MQSPPHAQHDSAAVAIRQQCAVPSSISRALAVGRDRITRTHQQGATPTQFGLRLSQTPVSFHRGSCGGGGWAGAGAGVGAGAGAGLGRVQKFVRTTHINTRK